MNKNAYTRTWFELFAETRPFTQSEISFIVRNLPNPPFAKILDVCCGQGRHSNLLAQHGYEMLGVDLDGSALSIARQSAPQSTRYVHLDMRHLDQIDETFDAVILMWQSFGYFNELTNEAILQQISDKLRVGGRFILDIYNRAFWENNQGVKKFDRLGVEIKAHNSMQGNRLICQLDYGSKHAAESFNWQLYYHDEIIDLVKPFGLTHLLSGVECDEKKAVTDSVQQMQIVFEKV